MSYMGLVPRRAFGVRPAVALQSKVQSRTKTTPLSAPNPKLSRRNHLLMLAARERAGQIEGDSVVAAVAALAQPAALNTAPRLEPVLIHEIRNRQLAYQERKQVFRNLDEAARLETVQQHLHVRECALNEVFQGFKNTLDRPHVVMNLANAELQYSRWVHALPRVRPLYAIKCNPDPVLLSTLAHCGAGFDCASAAEILAALATGVSPNDIIFANPIKNVDDLKLARELQVTKMTFDNEDELVKIQEVFPEAELVLRLLPDGSGSVMDFGSKFGCHEEKAEKLLSLAKTLNLTILGTSFHIGSGCFDPTKYDDAIQMCRRVFDKAISLGLPPLQLVDVGGGFPGTTEVEDFLRTRSESDPSAPKYIAASPPFESFAAIIRQSLEMHFPEHTHPTVQFVGEPGRYFATAASTLFARVQGKRAVTSSTSKPEEKEKNEKFLYYLNDGVYGSFNNIMYDHFTPTDFHVQADEPPSRSDNSNITSGKGTTATFFGPTCDSIDVIAKDVYMPRELRLGEWLKFSNMGAYTTAAGSEFNGCKRPDATYIHTG